MTPLTTAEAASDGYAPSDAVTPEVSVVIPCLNEAETVAECVEVAVRALTQHHIPGEVIVADNGSTDGSQSLAEAAGARVVPVVQRGYGFALQAGIAAARGRFVVMGDADLSYDFAEIPNLVERLRGGADLVQGCRFPSGGGTIEPGAMPFLHRRFGNPLLSFLTRLWFDSPVRDVYCGLRAFRRELPAELNVRSGGMEYATEMIVKASLGSVSIDQIPITLHVDGRTEQEPHLRTFRDGWRTLRFLLLSTPGWLFRVPGAALMLGGFVFGMLGLLGAQLGSIRLDAHTLLVGSLGMIVGHQAVWFSAHARAYAASTGLLPRGYGVSRRQSERALEFWVVTGGVMVLLGIGLLAGAIGHWWRLGFGDLDYGSTMRWVIPGSLLVTLGIQTIFGSFFLAFLALDRE